MAFYYESTTHLTTFAMYTIAWQRAVYLFKAAPTAPSTQSRLYGNLSLQQLVREYLFSPIFQSAYSANTMNSLVARSRTCSSAVPVPRSQLALSSRHLAQQQRGPSAPKGVQFNEQFMEVLQQSLEREEQRVSWLDHTFRWWLQTSWQLLRTAVVMSKIEPHSADLHARQ